MASWIFFGFIIWIFAFWGFLTSKFTLTSDALSYYDHTKFFIENISHSVFPLWDPYWCNGVSNDFFLRRIGALNPFYSIILILRSIGIPYTLSYLWFLALYYWGGMIAFYLLAMRIYQNRFIAYAGYLILMFSALGTRLFDSYMMLVTVPLIWFFYFLIAFSQTPRKHFFLGMTLSFMILVSTYIPFYFLIILGLFTLLFFLTYFNILPEIFRRYIKFFKENKLLVVLSLLVLAFSFFPIINFFQNTSHGQVVLPIRHGSSISEHTLTVPHQTLDWGAVEDLMYSYYFSNLKLYKFAVVYVPFFAVILFILGLVGTLSRRAVFLFLLGIVLSCCIVPHGLPFYDFFYKHFFFLKYFRNLHFFIWFFLIPLFVFLGLEHWKIFTDIKIKNDRHKWFLMLYVLSVHLIVFLFVWHRRDAVLSTYVMIFSSLVLCSLTVLKYLKSNVWGFALLTLTVLVQPMEAYHYFSLKCFPHTSPYAYDFSFNSLKINDDHLIKREDVPAAKDALYYASGGYNFIYQNISNYALAKYLQNKFILVDHLDVVDRKEINPAVLERNFLTNDNVAVIFKDSGDELDSRFRGNDNLLGNGKKGDPHPPLKAQRIDNTTQGFKLLAFDADHMRLTLDLPYEKFLIYNDSFDPSWRVSVNHQPSVLYEVNGAFKGVWVPSGKNIIEFSYGGFWQYAMNIILSFFAFIFLLGIIYYVRFS